MVNNDVPEVLSGVPTNWMLDLIHNLHTLLPLCPEIGVDLVGSHISEPDTSIRSGRDKLFDTGDEIEGIGGYSLGGKYSLNAEFDGFSAIIFDPGFGFDKTPLDLRSYVLHTRILP